MSAPALALHPLEDALTAWKRAATLREHDQLRFASTLLVEALLDDPQEPRGRLNGRVRMASEFEDGRMVVQFGYVTLDGLREVPWVLPLYAVRSGRSGATELVFDLPPVTPELVAYLLAYNQRDYAGSELQELVWRYVQPGMEVPHGT